MAELIAFDRTFDAKAGQPDMVAPGVRRILAPNPGPFTFTGTCTYLVGTTDLIVIDPGPDDASHVAAILQAAGHSRIGQIVLTHSHGDHVGAVAALKAATGAPVLAARHRDRQRRAAGPALDAAVLAGFEPDRVIEDGTRIESADAVLEAVATPGHASDHMALALSDSRVLFSGDHVMGWSTSVVAPPDGEMAAYMASLRRLIARPETIYLPGHGGIVTDGPELVGQLIRHRLARSEAIRAAVEAGDRQIPDIVARVYVGLDPRLVAAAGRSVLAHLEELLAMGVIAADGPLRDDSQFRPV